MEIFKGLQPELVWSYFEEICKIPRPSKKEEKILLWRDLIYPSYSFIYNLFQL